MVTYHINRPYKHACTRVHTHTRTHTHTYTHAHLQVILDMALVYADGVRACLTITHSTHLQDLHTAEQTATSLVLNKELWRIALKTSADSAWICV